MKSSCLHRQCEQAYNRTPRFRDLLLCICKIIITAFQNTFKRSSITHLDFLFAQRSGRQVSPETSLQFCDYSFYWSNFQLEFPIVACRARRGWFPALVAWQFSRLASGNSWQSHLGKTIWFHCGLSDAKRLNYQAI